MIDAQVLTPCCSSYFCYNQADRCLDMGFQKDMQRILEIINQHSNKDVPRQTLLFSATIPPGVREIMASALREDYITVDCIEDVDPTTHTNDTVDQTFVTLPDPNDNMVNTNDLYRLSKKRDGNSKSTDTTQYRWISGLVDIIEDIIHVQNPTDFKLVVFFPTTSTTQFFSYVFNKIYKIPVIEMHSQKHQSNRTVSRHDGILGQVIILYSLILVLYSFLIINETEQFKALSRHEEWNFVHN